MFHAAKSHWQTVTPVGTPDAEPVTNLSLRRHLVAGSALVAVLLVGAGGWAATANIAGAVVAPGVLVAASDVKKVQHPTGGIVGALRARDGDRVEAGQVLVQLDDTVTQANLGVVTRELDALTARQARLRAERDGFAHIAVPAELQARIGDPQIRQIVDGEQRLFEMRRAARAGQKAQLEQQITQISREIEGTASQERANRQEIALARRELDGTRTLWDQRLVTLPRLVAQEREVTRLEGARGQYAGTVARLRGQIAEIRLQIVQIDRDLGTEVGQELRDVDRQIGELTERRVAAEDQLRRVDIRAPQSGTVHASAVHTVGGVVTPDGQPLMLIVPDGKDLAVEAHVRPQDIDQIKRGGTAKLRFTALNQRTTPELSGTVNRVAADVTRDPQSGAEYYTIRITVPEKEIGRLGEVRLVPGMPVEAFVQTGGRTVLSYIFKPLTDQVAKAFREH